MADSFYLDDYNLISTNLCGDFLNAEIKLFKNKKEINYTISAKDNKVNISFVDAYEDGDKFEILFNQKKYKVITRFIVQTKRFEEEYKVDLNTLGSFYFEDYTLFRIWAPLNDEVKLYVKSNFYKMDYLGKGVFEKRIAGSLDKESYFYELKRNDEIVRVVDPFSYANSKGNYYSYIIDTNKINKNKIKVNNNLKTIIYETSVRDFSYDTNASFKHKGKFLGLIENNLKLEDEKIGLDYLKDLGITHIQLMPVLNFDFEDKEYNWGYNPINYNTFCLDYVEGDDAYSSINEFKEMVDGLHKNNLRVVLDVVYNHVYKPNRFDLNKILPYYFFRYDDDGILGDASYCGNELRSESYFLGEYFRLINRRLIDIYDIDGLRYDLMGILDKDLINTLYSDAISLKNDFIFYGEGWNMGTLVSEDKKAIIKNAKDMEGVKFFSDLFRNTLRGDVFEKSSTGYSFGNSKNEIVFIDAMQGSKSIGLNENQTINYVECHDNMTIFDKLSYLSFSEIEIENIAKTLLALVLLGHGTSFIQSGQEFLRTKEGFDNTYNLSSDINKLDWERMCNKKNIVDYFKKMVYIKNNYLVDGDYYVSKYYDLLILSKGRVDIFINPTQYEYRYDNWITYKDIYDINGEVKNNLKGFTLAKFSLIVAIKE